MAVVDATYSVLQMHHNFEGKIDQIGMIFVPFKVINIKYTALYVLISLCTIGLLGLEQQKMFVTD